MLENINNNIGLNKPVVPNEQNTSSIQVPKNEAKIADETDKKTQDSVLKAIKEAQKTYEQKLQDEFEKAGGAKLNKELAERTKERDNLKRKEFTLKKTSKRWSLT